MPDARGQLLRAAVGFSGCSLPSYDRALHALRFVQAIAPPLAALVLAGCVFSHPAYPPGWAPLETPGTGCVSISGTYEDEGEPKLADSTASLLHNFPFPRNTSLGGANNVVIAQPAEGVIEIAAWYNTEVVTATKALGRRQ